MKNNVIYISLLVLSAFTFSCKKTASMDANMNRLCDCNASQHFDTLTLAARLIGNWKWVETSAEMGTRKADKNVKVTFGEAHTFVVTENGSVIGQGHWRLVVVDSGVLGLETDAPSLFLNGRILLCGDELLFNNSFVDGSDNLFKR